MSSPSSPFTGFGDDPHRSVKFGLRRTNGELSQWQGGRKISEHDVGNGDNDHTQVHGWRPLRVSWKLVFASLDAYWRLFSLQGTAATLRYRAGITPNVGGSIAPVDPSPVLYQTLPGTILLSLSDAVVEVGGAVEATASFKVPYVAPVYPEPEPWPESPPWPKPFGFGEGPFGLEPFGNPSDGLGEP